MNERAQTRENNYYDITHVNFYASHSNDIREFRSDGFLNFVSYYY